jgi:hypothetical protein
MRFEEPGPAWMQGLRDGLAGTVTIPENYEKQYEWGNIEGSYLKLLKERSMRDGKAKDTQGASEVG